ncbi:MAG: hypothetical protein ACKV2Q_13455 [Planctomycetaceae bacterium]
MNAVSIRLCVFLSVLFLSVLWSDAASLAEDAIVAEFKACDANDDGVLTEAEYLKRVGREQPVLLREFKVFDIDRDGKMTQAEFVTVPVGQADELRGKLADPVVLLSEKAMARLAKEWKTWDQNGDDSLSAEEFKAGGVAAQVRGLEATGFGDWDLNRDGLLSRQEVARVLDIAFGVRAPSGELLRDNIGRVVDWRMFLALKPDANGQIAREDYIKALGPNQKPETWFPTIFAAENERFDITAFSTSSHRTDPVQQFLAMDADLSGSLSPAELAGLPAWGPPGKNWLAGFDDDKDGTYSLSEFLLIPHVNLMAVWHAATDTNGDGKLSLEEFRFMPAPALAALGAEYFRRLDLNQDQALSLTEWPFHTTHAGAKFVLLDANSDGQLTEAEFTAEGSLPANRLSRDFKVFDADSDGRMTLAEFLTIPHRVPEAQRTPIPDPIVLLSEKAFKGLTDQWGEWDSDGDGMLNAKEFETAKLGEHVRGLVATKLADWDWDRDQKVSREEAAKLVDVAFGVRIPGGELVREPSGRVVDWRMFCGLKLDREGFVSVMDYAQALGAISDDEKKRWIAKTDQNGDGKFNWAEFAKSDHRTDPVGTFLQLDADLDGRLTPKELKALTVDQQPIAACMFPGFDDDRDGGLSLREFQLTPLVNFLAHWGSFQDADEDGNLQLAEFRFHPGVALSALGAEYFRRLDVHEDGALSLEEFPFITTRPPPNEIRVRFADGRVLAISIPDYPNIFSPEISPDGKWVAVDGWKRGENNISAHLLIASLETDEVRDLGIGCIPHWSADSRRIAYSKYSQGVFVRDFELDSEEESIDPQGWAIEFSPDGKKFAYFLNGNNFVIRDVASNEKRSLFAEGKGPYQYIEHNFAWSPDSQRICFKGHRAAGGLEVGIVTTTGDDPKLRVLCDAKDVASDFSWLADQRLMFPRTPAGATKSQIHVIDPDGESGKPSERYAKQPANRNNVGVSWSRDGKTFVYISTR